MYGCVEEHKTFDVRPQAVKMPCYEGVAEEMSRVWFFGLNGDDVAAPVMDKQSNHTPE